MAASTAMHVVSRSVAIGGSRIVSHGGILQHGYRARLALCPDQRFGGRHPRQPQHDRARSACPENHRCPDRSRPRAGSAQGAGARPRRPDARGADPPCGLYLDARTGRARSGLARGRPADARLASRRRRDDPACAGPVPPWGHRRRGRVRPDAGWQRAPRGHRIRPGHRITLGRRVYAWRAPAHPTARSSGPTPATMRAPKWAASSS